VPQHLATDSGETDHLYLRAKTKGAMVQQNPRRLAGQCLPYILLGVAALFYAHSAFTAGTTTPQHASAGLFTGLPTSQKTARADGLNAFASDVPGTPEVAAASAPRGFAARAMGFLPHVAALASFALGARRRGLNWHSRFGKVASRAEAAAPAPIVEEKSAIMQAANIFCNLFAVWLAIAAVAALKAPSTFNWIPAQWFTGLLGLLMFSVGITTTLDDFKQCLQRPGAVAINFISCYGIMPALAYFLAKLIGAEGAILAGMVLVGSVNGGQASNLCTLIAGGDVALSVLMTTSTTLGCIAVTPLICKLVLGTVVPIDAMGIVISTFQVVLAPIFIGVFLNMIIPKVCKALAPFTPVVGVISTVMLVGASVANCAGPIINAGLPLQAACLGLHLFGGILGFWATKLAGYDARTCRTVAIETAMKSSAFGFLLASLHFGSFNARVPAAVSVVWMAIVGSTLAVYWKGCSEDDEACEFDP